MRDRGRFGDRGLPRGLGRRILKALLFSGGIDSTAVAWLERPDALMFVDYGQVAAAGERRAARAVASALGMYLDERAVPLSSFGSGTMAGRPVPGAATPETWPFRNQMLITLAAMAYAGAVPLEVLVGTVAGDDAQPDGGPAFVIGIDAVLATQGRYRVRAPAVAMDTAALVAASGLPVEVLGWTFSCHTGEWACGRCRGCAKHDAVKEQFR